MRKDKSVERFWESFRHGMWFFGALSVMTVASCGEKREVVEVVEEDESTAGATSGTPSRKKVPKTQAGTEGSPAAGQGETATSAPEEGGAAAAEPGAAAAVPGSSPAPSQNLEQPAPARYALEWEPLAVSAIVTTYCAGACHGVHGQFASKDYFTSLKVKHLEQLKSGKMPPPRLFANFKGSADEAALINWLEQQ